MSFQMVLLQSGRPWRRWRRFGTMSFQMVLLHISSILISHRVLELCHSRWFYYFAQAADELSKGFGTMSFQMVLLLNVYEITPDGRFWNYVIPDGSTTFSVRGASAIWFWNYVIPDGSTTVDNSEYIIAVFWNYVIPDGSTTVRRCCEWAARFWNYVIPDGSTT